MAYLQFIDQTGAKKDDPTARKMIRRHVMLGKNKGRTPNSNQPDIEVAKILTKDDWHAAHLLQRPRIPKRLGSDLSFLNFAEEVDLSLMNNTLRFCHATSENLFVLEPCISFDPRETRDMCIHALSRDALYLNVMVFSALEYINTFRIQPELTWRRASAQHYGKALTLLRGRLAGADRWSVEITDMTVFAILPLAMHALITADLANARNHVLGVSRLVRMREGGLHGFWGRTKLMIELLRCDVSVSLATGQTPVFFAGSPHEPMLPLPARIQTLERSLPISTIHELRRIWDILHRFCIEINNATASQKKLPEQVLLETMAPAMYRLLHMAGMESPTDEALRLAMLSFCVIAFLRWRELRMPFTWLQLALKNCIAGLMRSRPPDLDPEFILWLLITYSGAFFPLTARECEEITSWGAELAELCGLSDWDDVRKIASIYLWIDIVYNAPARKFFDQIT